MKKIFTAAICFSAFAMQSHADYISQPPSSFQQAQTYAQMSVDQLIKAAKSGEKGAQFYLGTRLQHGVGVKSDVVQAFQWYKKAADQGLAAAQLNVGRMLVQGIGVKQDVNTGKRYLEMSAKAGDNRASYNLGMIAEQDKNYQVAYQWYELAAREEMLDNKVMSASETRKLALAATLTQDQIRAARDRAYQWITE